VLARLRNVAENSGMSFNDILQAYVIERFLARLARSPHANTQVTVPKKVRDYLGLKPGAAVTFERLDNGEIALRATKAGAKRRISKFTKLRGRATVRMTTEEILALTRGN
jgi:AbrB family looped-hinge helix DNA binding protein